jgi:SOS-response transcriptional repressor LexA
MVFYTQRTKPSTKKVRNEPKKCDTARAMIMTKEKLTKEKARRLRAAREAVEPNRSEAVRKFRFNYNTYKGHESGERDFDSMDAALYAKAFKVTVNHLLALDLIDSNFSSMHTIEPVDMAASTIPVYGQAAGGMWLEGEDMPLDDTIPMIAPQVGYPASVQYARKVVGNSISNRIRNGEYAVMVRLAYYDRPLQRGDLVDCLRVRGGLYEHSIKEFHGDALMTNSAELQTQVSIPLDAPEDDTTVEVLGIVIAAVRVNP